MPTLMKPDPLSALLLGKRSTSPLSSNFAPQAEDYSYDDGNSVPTQGELSSPFEQEQAARANRADAEDRARLKSFNDERASALAENDPTIKAARDASYAEKYGLAVGPAKATAAGNLAVEHAKEGAATQERRGQQDFMQQLMGNSSSSAGEGGINQPGGMRMSINAKGEPSFTPPTPAKPLGQLEQRAITSFKEAQPILDDLERTLAPASNQLMSLLKNAGGSALYSSRLVGDPTEGKKMQLSGLLTVLGSSPYVVGSRSYQMIKKAMEHLTAPGPFGPGSDKFLKGQIDEIRSLWPRMQQEVLAAHDNPSAPLNQGALANDPYADENWGKP